MKLVPQGIVTFVFKEKTNGLRGKEIKKGAFQEIKTWGKIKCKSVLRKVMKFNVQQTVE